MMPKKQTSKPHFFTMPRIIVVLLVLMLAFFGAWFLLRTALVNGIVNSIKNSEDQGYQIGHDGLSVNGFPFSINARSSNISVRAPNSQTLSANTNWLVKLDEVSARTKTIMPLQWSAQHSGTMRVDMRGPSGARYMFDITPAALTAQGKASLTGTLKSFDINVAPTQLTSLVGAPPPVRSTGSLEGHFKAVGTDGHIAVISRDIILSPATIGLIGNTLGHSISSTQLNAIISHWPVFQSGDMTAWQNSGGHITSDNWSVKWGDLDMVGTFDIGFIDTLPDGNVHIEVKNLEQLMGTLIQNGLIPSSIASQAQMFLGTIKANENGRQELDITIQKGVVKYGFLTLYKF